MEPLLITSSLIFGREVVTQTISGSTKNILSGVNSIMEDEDFAFKKLLEDCDLKSRVDIINTYLGEINENNFTSDSIKMALKYLSDILKKIETEIQTIEIKIKEHKELWFHRFRTPEYKTMLQNLVTHIKILDERFNLFIKIKN